MDSSQVDRSDIGEGRYANYVEIGHTANEFVFDFGQVWGNGDTRRLYVRVVTTPETAERLLEALKDGLTGYDRTFGDIRHNSDEDEKTA
jgi:Protein of unknown function (DUF3467)